MTKSSSKSLDVFDFKEEDDVPEFSSDKLANRFKFSSPLNKKLNLFGKATKGTNFEFNEMGTLPFVEDDGKGGDLHGGNGISDAAVHMEEDSGSMKMCGLDGVSLFNSSSRCHPQSVLDLPKPGSFPAQLGIGNFSPEVSPGRSPLLCSPSGSPTSTESVDTSPDVDDSIIESSPSTSSDVPGDEVPLGRHDSLSGHCIEDSEMGEGDIAVRPDYVVCQGRCYTNSVLFFSSSCLRLKDIRVFGNQGTLSFQWDVDDIVEIESEWSKRYEFARVRLSLISKDVSAPQEGTSGIEHINFGIFDPNWPEKQEKLVSLDVRYKAIWNVAFRTDTVVGEALPGQSRFVIPWRSFNEPFDEVVYPKGDIDAVSISKRDVDLLQPDTFVNDTIIDFYIKYLKNEIEPEKRQRFHFFNSFFFRKLIDLDKDSPSSFEGRAAFQRVRKWTRKVNVFEKDYVFIPVNYNYHWSLIVICHPGEIAKCPDEDSENLHKVPCILHMDSIKGTHSGLKEFVQSYLWEEWKERQKDACEDTATKFSNLRFVSLELPQQQNCFDCGLFLLHYVEHFLDEAPRYFSPFKITKFSNFLNEKWFSPGEPSLKRVYIQKLILKILEGENSTAASSDKPCPSNCRTRNNDAETDVVLVTQRCSPSKSFHEPVHNRQADQGIHNDTETGVVLVAQRCSPSKSFHEPVPNPNADQGIEITLLPTSAGDAGMVLREFFEDGAEAAEVFHGQYQVFDRTPSFGEFRGALPSTTEHVEDGGDVFPSNRSDYQQSSGMNFEACDYPYSFRDLEGERSQNTGDEDGDINASTETSMRVLEDSLKVEIKDRNEEEVDLGKEENMDQPSSIPTENVEYVAESLVRTPDNLPNAVADSQSPEQMIDDDNGDQFICFPESAHKYCEKDIDAQDGYVTFADETCLLGGNFVVADPGQKESSGSEIELQNIKRISDDMEQESDDQQPSKRLRLEPTI